MAGVFVSYRRSDGAGHTGRVAFTREYARHGRGR
jgi:hypothetical protein